LAIEHLARAAWCAIDALRVKPSQFTGRFTANLDETSVNRRGLGWEGRGTLPVAAVLYGYQQGVSMQKGMTAGLIKGRTRLRRRIKCNAIVLSLALSAGAGFAGEPGGTKHIYRCEVNGQTTFGDRPCANAPSAEVVLTPANFYHPDAKQAGAPTPTSGRTTKSLANRDRGRSNTDSIAAEQAKERQRCQRLADQLTSIRAKMQSGYTAEQGEKLRERQRQLERQRRTEHCR
jgi:hypothetical protein